MSSPSLCRLKVHKPAQRCQRFRAIAAPSRASPSRAAACDGDSSLSTVCSATVGEALKLTHAPPSALYELAALDPATATAVANGLGPLLNVGTLLFIVRHVVPSPRLSALLTSPQDRHDVVSQREGRRVPLEHRLCAHRATAGSHAEAHHASRVCSGLPLAASVRSHCPLAAWTCPRSCGLLSSAS